ncbi:MAG: hypothetical protein HY927_10200 [Elusimicrobia bacterium]|nr:hypothetical protein [Elusimicrobiota bacterium]
MPIVRVSRDNDPFKKYWWVLLVGFGLIGLWVLFPLLGQTGSARVAMPRQSAPEDQGLQSLDSSLNPAGAPGSAVDLSMDGSGYKKKNFDEPVTSSLYQAPGAAAGQPIAASSQTTASASASAPAAGATLASALKDVSKNDPKGWGGAKPQKGFNAPKGSFGGLSGVGAASGSSGASMSATPFNSPTAQVAFDTAQGIGAEEGGAQSQDSRRYMRTLRAAQSKSILASKMKGTDSAKDAGGKVFDGNTNNKTTIAGAGQGTGGVFGKFDYDSAPTNLKNAAEKAASLDDDMMSKLNKGLDDVKEKTFEADNKDMMNQQMMQMMMMMAVSGVAGGGVGSMAMPMMMMMMQNAQTNASEGHVKKN